MTDLKVFVRDRLKNSPFRTMYCPECCKTTWAAAWWTPDENMLDWYCPRCWKPLETVVMDRNRSLTEYMLSILHDEYPPF